MRTSLVFLAATASALQLQPSCTTDACYNAILGPGSAIASSFCSANLPTATSTAYATSISTIVATITDVATQTDETTVLQTLEFTEFDATTITSGIGFTETSTYVAVTSIETLTIVEKRDEYTLKKRKICTPKSSSSSTTMTSSTLANPTSICTNPSQIVSACSCLGITEPTVVQTSTIVLPSTFTNTIESTATVLLTETIVLTESTTLISTALAVETSTIIASIPMTAISTVTETIQPTPSCFVLRMEHANPPSYITLEQSPAGMALTFTNDLSSAANFTIDAASHLLSLDTNNIAYGAASPDADASMTLQLALTSLTVAAGRVYSELFFALRNDQGFPANPPYHVGDTGKFISTNAQGSFLECTGDLYVSEGLICNAGDFPSSLFLDWVFV